MQRSLADRPGLARPAWLERLAVGLPLGGGHAGRSRRAPRARRAEDRQGWRAGLLHGGAVAADLPRAIWAHRRARLVAICAVAAMVVLGGGWLALRRSSFVAVHDVKISGLHGSEAGVIAAALQTAGRHVSTLDPDYAVLREAVASYPVVSELHASVHFPHGLQITVVERPAVAALVFDGTRTAVAADGTVLGPALLSSSLPVLADNSMPAPGEHLNAPWRLAALAVMGAVPQPVAHFIKRLYEGAHGLTVQMSDGLLVYFGDGARPLAKWLALARVLADESSKGASYVDVRLPERPAAGFPDGVDPNATTSTTTLAAGSAPQSPVAALAAGLAAETGVGSQSTGAAAGTTAEPATGAGTGTASASPTGTESTSQAGGEASSEAPSTGVTGTESTATGGAATGTSEVPPPIEGGAEAPAP